MKQFFQDILNFFTSQGMYILLGILVFVAGLFAIKYIKKLCVKIFKRKNADGSKVSFVISIIDFLLKIVLLIVSLSIMNVNSTSILAVISTCGIAIGLALKDSLSNLASGIIIVYSKPFKEGDLVDINGNLGKVVGINLFNTLLCTVDNKKIVLPNSTVLNSPLTNYDSRPTRRVDFTFSVAYGTDLKKAKKVILDAISKHSKILKTPEPTVRLLAHNTSSLDFAVKVWTMTADYWDVFYDMNENVYEAFVKNNIVIPFNQLDVHITKDE